VMRADGNEITRSQWSLRAFGVVGLGDFFNDGLAHMILLLHFDSQSWSPPSAEALG
jgi:hypothetical protein